LLIKKERIVTISKQKEIHQRFINRCLQKPKCNQAPSESRVHLNGKSSRTPNPMNMHERSKPYDMIRFSAPGMVEDLKLQIQAKKSSKKVADASIVPKTLTKLEKQLGVQVKELSYEKDDWKSKIVSNSNWRSQISVENTLEDTEYYSDGQSPLLSFSKPPSNGYIYPPLDLNEAQDATESVKAIGTDCNLLDHLLSMNISGNNNEELSIKLSDISVIIVII
jgi:hypothetical protein